ncbi:MAG: phytase [Bacteroidales bacterium]|jgi:3-phytase|nr:phytase [Bacteroidales bacterium]
MTRLFLIILLVSILSSCGQLLNSEGEPYPCIEVTATAETEPVYSLDDAADDPAIWIHPTDPAKSLIIATNKKAGLEVYTLSGKRIFFTQSGRVNNVDVRYGFPMGNQMIDIVAASNRSFNTISLYQISEDTLVLKEISARTITSGLDEVYGFCLYKSANTGKFYAFVNSKNGNVEQWELFATADQKIDAALVRNFHVGLQTEGCVADDALGYFYIGEENAGIWKYFAEPDHSNDRKMIADTSLPYITADIEGLTIYQAAGQKGYLIASIQGDNLFAVFEREGKNRFIGCFRIGETNEIDEVTETDGIDVINLALNEQFPNGFFIAQDGYNFTTDGKKTTQNFKLIPWETIAGSFDKKLHIDNSFNPRLQQ